MTRLAHSKLFRWALQLLLLAIVLTVFVPRLARAVLNNPPGGPVLVITSAQSTYGAYYPEILRNEGFNHYAVADIGSVSASTLAAYDVVILAKATLSATQATMFSTWVNGGGNLIAMAPDAQLAPLLGLATTGSTLAEGYLLINTAAAPGAGLVGQTMQYHGTADRYSLNGATSVATLYSSANAATTNPAVTTRAVGSGSASAFSFDLATSIVLMRHGNPSWATQERDGFAPIRSDDKFFGNAAGDPQPDWVDLSKVMIPQADEQQRLLANLIQHVNQNKKPLPRFWYFPHGKKAVVIMTGDDHANGGTAGRFDQLNAASPAGCSVADWECLRGTSYMYTATALSDAQAAAYEAQGHEVSLHLNTGCTDFSAASLQSNYATQVAEFKAKYQSLPGPFTQRHHCLVWSDWSTGADVQVANGMRLDTTYYFWPPGWVNNVPGHFTGSAMPMRFMAQDGRLIDVYQAATQMTDESGQSYPYTIDTLLDRALGSEGYYGAFTINAHTDTPTIAEGTAAIASVKARGVPMVSAKQMLNWLDGRNGSSFGSFGWNGSTLTFAITAGANTTGIQAMLPYRSGARVLNTLSRGGSVLAFNVQTIKGVEYAFFSGIGGTYAASYGTDGTAPTVTATSPAAGAAAVPVGTVVTATFSEAMSAATLNSNTFQLRGAGNVLVAATVTWDAALRTARLTPLSALAGSSTYTAQVLAGAQDLSGNAVAAVSWSFSTAAGASCPCSGWGSGATPANPSLNDTSAIEVGVKFRSDVDGFITGVRFYKGATNTGTHIGNLWSSGGTLLASATFSAETASGWQQVSFATPVAVTANTVYVASYYAPNGNYAADNNFFTTTGVDNGLIHLLPSGTSGGNGVYRYGPASAFPSQSYLDTNYWVDVVFALSGGPDTTAPTITASTPLNGATGVGLNSGVSVTFSEAIDPGSVSATSFELRNPGNVLIAASVNYNAVTRTATLTPSAALAANTSFTVTVRGGSTDPRIKDLSGNALAANASWSFTTGTSTGPATVSVWPATAAPVNAATNDPAATELGVKFRASVDGSISGIRFYKGATNTGTHVGSLWTSSGTLLASATFTNETASGWQEVSFATPIAVTANTVYVASYFAPNGNYAADNNYFAAGGLTSGPLTLLQSGAGNGNGVYRYTAASAFPTESYLASNYWVDVAFSATPTGPDTTPPTVTLSSPVNGAANVAASTLVRATFSEAIDLATLTAANFELRTAAGAAIAATLGYDASSRTATLSPSAQLPGNTTLTATVRGGATGIKDPAGNALASNVAWSFTTEVAGGACAAPANAIVAENCLAGTPASQWDVSGVGDAGIQGFATDISVNRGATVRFKVNTNAAAYRFDIYRMGFYAGNGARLVATVQPSAPLPQAQPSCLNDSNTGLIDCGNWAESGSWAVPATATSGIYFAKLTRTDTGGASHVFFVVRNDASTANLLFQTSDTTWQAYNSYGGNSLYTGSPAGRAYKVSYNRPFNTRSVDGGQDWVFGNEYPMVRWLESNGYDMSYQSGVDTDRLGAAVLRQHRVFVSVGHDEYWSGAQRANVESARNNGVHLAFFSGNEVFWKTRWEASIDGSNSAYRTLVSYKETHANAKIDPNAAWTGTWRDARFSPPADGGRPENALTGTIFMANATGQNYAIVIPEADGKMRFWRNTSVATLAAGQSAALPVGSLGYEWDADLDNGFRPPGLVRLSDTTLNISSVLQDNGSNYASGTLNHALTLYKHGSGALVFGAGTIQWSWGLDANHDGQAMVTDVRMQQATVNLFADMGAQPASLRAGLALATASADTTAPTSSISAPAAGANLALNVPVTVTGTATDTGGGIVGGVEVSVDGGATWRRASGRGAWSFSFTPTTAGGVVLRSRAADDSGNIEAPSPGRALVAGTDTTAPTIASRSPESGAAGVPTGSVISIGFSEAMDPASIGAASIELRNAANALVSGSLSYDSAMRSARFTPSALLPVNSVYTVRVLGGATDPRVKDVAGNALAATASWSFTSGGSAFANIAQGRAATQSSTGYGAPASRAVDGSTDGVFNNGSVTHTNFESQPWWEVDLGQNVLVDTVQLWNRTDCCADRLSNFYVLGSATPMTGRTLSQLLADTTVQRVSVGSLGAATNSIFALNAALPVRYVRVQLSSTSQALSLAEVRVFGTVDATAPTVTATTPAAGATGVSRTAALSATFSEAMDAGTITSANLTLRDAGGALVPASVSYAAASKTATIAPSAALAGSTTYTASVGVGVRDPSGNALAAARTWSFTTAAAPTNLAQGRSATQSSTGYSAPASRAVDGGTDGVFNNGSVTHTNFESQPWWEVDLGANALIDTVQLWNRTDCCADRLSSFYVLASATPMTGRTLSQLVADTSVRTVGIASFGTAASLDVALSGAAPMRYVRVQLTSTYQALSLTEVRVFGSTVAPDTTAPTVTATTPSSGATGVTTTSAVTVTFSEAMDASTITSANLTLRDGAGALVAASVSYAAATNTATLTPTAALASVTTYTATVGVGVRDASGNAMASARTWSFTTAQAPTQAVVAFSAPNIVGIGRDGSAVSGNGIGLGYTYSGTLLGSGLTWAGTNFTFGAAGTLNAVTNTTVTLPAGNYSSIKLLATGVNGNQPSRTFVVTYTDGTTTTVVQNLSDWYTPQSYAGESIVSTMAYRLTPTGARQTLPFYLYGYSLAINSGKTVRSITLPATANVAVVAMTLVP